MPNQFKKITRRSYKQIRSNLSMEYQARKSARICNQIQKLECYQTAENIALYYAGRGEVNLDSLWKDAASQGKSCFFPVLTADQALCFLPAAPNERFQKNKFGILEPIADLSLALSPDQLDILFMPLVAFDAKGNRLGMGGGFYDRTLTTLKPAQLLGVAYEFQHCPMLWPERWDVKMSGVVTESSVYLTRF